MATFRELTSVEAWRELLATATGVRSLMLYKHSYRCPIAARAKTEVEAAMASWAARDGNDRPEVTWALVDVVADRGVSNAAAQDLEIAHASPQLIWIRDGAAAWRASHGGITRDAIAETLNGA